MENGKIIPRTLYKYRDFNPWALKIFTEKSIYFASPTEFNDPFDCGIPLRFDLMTAEQHDEFNMGILINRFNVPEESARATLENLKKIGKVRTTVNDMSEWQLGHLHDHIRIFCLSKDKDNLLLWAHYANFHRGFCIGFDSDNLMSSTKAALGEVIYEDEFPELHPTVMDSKYTRRLQVVIKSKCWGYEKEYRLISFTSVKRYPIFPTAIKEVIFGCQTSVDKQKELIDMIKQDRQLQHVKFFKAEKIPFEFRVEIKPLAFL